MRKIAYAFAVLVGIYLLGRAIAEPWVIDMSNPATYHNDWGGPSLPGVLAVHCPPGLVFAGWALWRLRARWSRAVAARA